MADFSFLDRDIKRQAELAKRVLDIASLAGDGEIGRALRAVAADIVSNAENTTKDGIATMNAVIKARKAWL